MGRIVVVVVVVVGYVPPDAPGGENRDQLSRCSKIFPVLGPGARPVHLQPQAALSGLRCP